MTEPTTLDLTAEMQKLRAEILEAEKARVIDVTVRRAREEGYCSETIYVLRAVYPDHVGRFYDSSGTDCFGRTEETYNHNCSICGENHGATE